MTVREYRRVLAGALVLDGLYLIVSVCFSFFGWRTIPALVLGTAFTVLNSFLREKTVEHIIRMGEYGGRNFHLKSYLGRMTLAGLCMAAGFAWLDPFAVVVPMLAPGLTYLLLAVTGRDI